MELVYEIKPSVNQVKEKDQLVLELEENKYEALSPIAQPVDKDGSRHQSSICTMSIRNLIAFTSEVNLTIQNPRAKNDQYRHNVGGDIGSSGSGTGGHGGSSKEKDAKTITSAFNLNDPTSSAFYDNLPGAPVHYVFVVDLNTPWEVNLVKQCGSVITHLKWDHSGDQLFIGTRDGHCDIYSMIDNILNQWKLTFSSFFRGEPIINSAWMAYPRRVCTIPDKIENSPLYSEKYQVNVSQPAKSTGFGGKALDGIFVITGANKVHTMIINTLQDPAKSNTLHKSLSSTNQNTSTGSSIFSNDIAYYGDGDVVLASCSSESIRSQIKLTKINVDFDGFRNDGHINTDRSTIDPFYLPSDLPDNSKIHSVRFTNLLNPESVLVSVHLYQRKIKREYHEMDHDGDKYENEVGSKMYLYGYSQNMKKWELKSQIQFPSFIDSITSMPSQLLDMYNNQNIYMVNQLIEKYPIFLHVIAVSTKDGTMNLLKSDNLQQVFCGTNGFKKDDCSQPEIKRIKFSHSNSNNQGGGHSSSGFSSSKRYNSLQFSWCGSLLLAMENDSANFSLYKIPNNLDSVSGTILLEMSLVAGIDPWPILTCLKQIYVENVTDRLNENFSKQPQAVQSYYNIKMLTLKFLLSRHQMVIQSSLASQNHDQQINLTLHLVYGALKALLRPSDLSSHDKGPAESLSQILENKGDSQNSIIIISDVDKVLLHLEAKEYTVEASTLQSLQQFFQWIADLAMKLLASLPDLRSSRAPLYELSRDVKAIGILRELIVLMRIWGLISPICLPIFRKTSENLDVLPLLFRLLTRLYITSPNEPDESLIDECCLLSSEIQIPSITYLCNYFCSPYDIHSILNSMGEMKSIKNFNLQFEFGFERPINRPSPSTNANSFIHHHGILFIKKRRAIWIDCLRLIWLGRNPIGIKICNRCGCTTLIHMPTRSAANRAYDNRFLKSCPCGGIWKILFKDKDGHHTSNKSSNEPDTFFLNNL